MINTYPTDLINRYPMDFFESVYKCAPLSDTGRRQKKYMQLEQGGKIVGSILDVGCGTGKSTLYMAAQRHEMRGIDFYRVHSRKHRRTPLSAI
jgi:2-polyprenyl-3-methyl-5-hydroxy-6-metoxy-1,4-benzoquinol methylase